MSERNTPEPFKYVNTVLLEDVRREVTESGRRLLDYERYLDGLEHLKMRYGTLPAAVEQQVARSIQGNLADAQVAGRLILELATDLENLDALETLISSIDRSIAPGGVAAALTEHSDVLEAWLDRHGMPTSTWRWALGWAEWGDVGARVESGAVIITRGDQTIGVISATRNGAMDAMSFVARANGLGPNVARLDDAKGPIHLSMSELIELAVRELIAFYQSRTQRTVMNGVQVLPTGAWWIVVIIVIAVILVVTAVSLLILCDIGSITDNTVCTIAAVILVIGIVALAVGTFGKGASEPGGSDPGPLLPDEDPDG